ncbi:iron chelate uptake ABC transporter family permease subunit [Neorhizobium galegae]|uniref:iron chelate uptake ABC transporter family permease subunit n=1 Tax=Neorhizobium galegae TaxID=399 RepID=UPI000620F720|nr:iron chelate uptake ABC transporter family permease subunit [Neorhizobium galegae]MCQ1776390.1 iron chelate uptake ABC transporter family permease subunit [Neorhizobium galegae]MCQ1798886.1 iron chelate uptake ABC transporter family permease subunit [Neorhizobium galegae]CDZ42191.1 Putative ABC transporter permease protein YclO [Neorhizobium galegae bv. officinalis]
MSERRLLFLAGAALLCIVAFMTIGLRGNIGFVLALRATKLAALLQVSVSIAISTVIFQTVTNNRILTPSIMGLDALYLFGQMLLVFLLGGLGYAALDAQLKFGGEIVVLMALATGLLSPMLRRRAEMGLMLLAGIIFGILFRSLHSLLARLVDPNDFAVVQGASFANFNDVRTDLLAFASILTIAGIVIAWRARHVLDVIALGADTATGLGISWSRTVTGLLLLVSALVAVSTALVGPVAFFGLLVVALAERVVDTRSHAALMPAAVLTAVIILVGGQTLFQHALGSSSTLGVVIEFVGGLAFLVLLVFGSRK